MALSMEYFKDVATTRRGFLKTTGALAATSSLALPQGVHAAENDETIRVGLVGCGGRGCGAAINCMRADKNVRLVALADLFPDKLDRALKAFQTSRRVAANRHQVQIDKNHMFHGFDAYQKLIDSDVDVVLLCSVPQFRPEHLAAAIKAGKHVFCEKPVAVDAPGVRSVLESCKKAKEKKLAVVSGLCYRYDPVVLAVMEKIHNGEIGDIKEIQETYVTGLVGRPFPRKQGMSELEYQIRNWFYFSWLSGDHNVEQHIHSLDKAIWALGDVDPVRAWGMGARVSRKLGNIYDQHAVVYEFPGGIRVHSYCRQQPNCYTDINDYIVGTTGTANAIASNCRIDFTDGRKRWRYRGNKPSMYDAEHVAFIKSIKDGKPINNGDYMCRATMTAILGRMVDYTGKCIEYKDALASEEQLAPNNLTWNSAPPTKPKKDGSYPYPIPGF